MVQDGNSALSPLAVVSKALFGQQRMIELAVVIANGPETFTLTEAAQALQVKPSSVQRPMTSLATAGLVTRTERNPAERIQWLHREPSVFWALVKELSARPSEWAPRQLTFEEAALFELE